MATGVGGRALEVMRAPMISMSPLALALAWVLGTAACTADSGGRDDACEQVEKARREAVDEYCSTMTALCCFCACWTATGHYDQEVYLGDGSCQCIAPPAGEAGDGECEGDALEEAEDCLDDLDDCVGQYLAGKQLACEATPI